MVTGIGAVLVMKLVCRHGELSIVQRLCTEAHDLPQELSSDTRCISRLASSSERKSTQIPPLRASSSVLEHYETGSTISISVSRPRM